MTVNGKELWKSAAYTWKWYSDGEKTKILLEDYVPPSTTRWTGVLSIDWQFMSMVVDVAYELRSIVTVVYRFAERICDLLFGGCLVMVIKYGERMFGMIEWAAA